jgi:chromosome segregation ATPase
VSEAQHYIKSINEKLQRLLKQYHHLQKENKKLAEALAGYAEKEKEATQKIDELHQQLLIAKSATLQMSGADKAAFEKRINQYIKEVDKCIALLSE